MEEREVVCRIFAEIPTATRVYVKKYAYDVACPEHVENLFDVLSEEVTVAATAQSRWVNCILCDSSNEEQLKAEGVSCYEREDCVS